ncbi:Retrovirus-related Pol polyprotein from transposon TNT 1-94 [Gossypium australe]|uniref:Retrovirus-related Pol polyprotein from transposon TNT 1-94 n=1 Tax=Gossypium australe TaxID=47621 RepID=A0A5B6VY72_9ROSI|nr:Retrovirus-related Pol polyprotein from transposon TNT 1-94 [Gossypium australe]
MATLKYDISLLDRNIRFTLWQVKMKTILVEMDLDDALLGDGELLVASVGNSKVSEEWILYSELKRNLISLSALDSKGYKYIIESGVLKINNGSLVMMKGLRKIAKLYVLQGSTVTGDTTVTSSSLSDDDVTRLWHMHIGHISENDMVELSKRRFLDGQGISKLKFCEHCILRSKIDFNSPKESITRKEC